MTPTLRPLQPLLNITTLRWGSKPRPRHVFGIQRYLFHGAKSGKEEFPYHQLWWPLKREELLRRLEFPREYMPYWSKVWWSTSHIPQLLVELVRCGVPYFLRRIRTPRSTEAKGIIVKSRVGRFFHDFVIETDYLTLLNKTMRPWGHFGISLGSSMEPTLSAQSSIQYSSYAYVDTQEVSRGDVVTVLAPHYDEKKELVNKRVAALEGERVMVARTPKLSTQIVRVPPGHCFVIGDNARHSRDSRHYGTLPIEAIWSKMQWQWGCDGFRWINHNQHPWLKNKAVTHLAPGQNHPNERELLEQQLKKSPTVVPRPKVRPLPPPSPPKQQQKPKKERKDPRKKS